MVIPLGFFIGNDIVTMRTVSECVCREGRKVGRGGGRAYCGHETVASHTLSVFTFRFVSPISKLIVTAAVHRRRTHWYTLDIPTLF